MSTPAATVVIPCYNQGRFVRKAVDSSLAQRDADVRVVLVDDGSSDGATPAACDACAAAAGERVSVIHQANAGLPAARNRGAREVGTPYVVFLDADDWIERSFVSRLAQVLEAQRAGAGGEDISHAYCQERLVDKGVGVWRVPDWDPLLMMITNIHPVTALVRTECFRAVGGFDETMTGGYEDWDLWLKFLERGWRGVRVREPLFVWRRHSHSTMIMRVIQDHDALYRRIIAQHEGLYARHATELLARSNVMLRRFDVNWLDETGDSINLRALRRARDVYEAMPAVRLHRALSRAIGSLPRPLATPARLALGVVKRLVPEPRARRM